MMLFIIMILMVVVAVSACAFYVSETFHILEWMGFVTIAVSTINFFLISFWVHWGFGLGMVVVALSEWVFMGVWSKKIKKTKEEQEKKRAEEEQERWNLRREEQCRRQFTA